MVAKILSVDLKERNGVTTVVVHVGGAFLPSLRGIAKTDDASL